MDDVIASLVKYLAQFKGVDKVVLIFYTKDILLNSLMRVLTCRLLDWSSTLRSRSRRPIMRTKTCATTCRRSAMRLAPFDE